MLGDEGCGLRLAVLVSGICGLSWEIVFQHRASLAMGVSAFGTAVTLAALMAGLGLGGLLVDLLDRRERLGRPLRLYGFAEVLVGVGGLFVPVGLTQLSALDRWVFVQAPGAADTLHAAGILLLLLVPSVAMGAALPVLVPVARARRVSVAHLYALNVGGAVLGIALITFVALPLLGVMRTTWAVALLNFAVGAWAITAPDPSGAREHAEAVAEPIRSTPNAAVIAFTSGFVVLALEVSWFRSIRAALMSTTESFAVMLAAFLLWLSIGGWLAPRLRSRHPNVLEIVCAVAGLAVLCFTPLVDGLDRMVDGDSASYAGVWHRMALVGGVVAVPVTLLGLVFPTLLDEQQRAGGVGRLYAWNTAGATLGALGSGFVGLPLFGATQTSWAAGVCIALAAIAARPTRAHALRAALLVGAGLFVAGWYGGAMARGRVQGFMAEYDFRDVLFVEEGPESTTWVTIKNRDKTRSLVIDGFAATGEGGGTGYMAWMGHLPVLAARELETALVICFGTGQTANAVRHHRPRTLEIVEVNRTVFRAAPFFESNRGVLHDPSVRAVVMDGRAFLRRTPARFDVITLEPMPPNFLGANALYSREFYELVRARLQPGGAVAQWVPYHLIAPDDMRAIVGTFRDVFPHSKMWRAQGGTGILVGALGPWDTRTDGVPLPLSMDEVKGRYWLDAVDLEVLGRGAGRITDDNQQLSYGTSRLTRSAGGGTQWSTRIYQESMALIQAKLAHRAVRSERE